MPFQCAGPAAFGLVAQQTLDAALMQACQTVLEGGKRPPNFRSDLQMRVRAGGRQHHGAQALLLRGIPCLPEAFAHRRGRGFVQHQLELLSSWFHTAIVTVHGESYQLIVPTTFSKGMTQRRLYTPRILREPRGQPAGFDIGPPVATAGRIGMTVGVGAVVRDVGV